MNDTTKTFSADRRKKLVLSYAKDWVLVIVLLIIFLAIDKTEPYHRLFSLNDRSIQYTYAVHERVPTWLLVVVAVIVPLVLMIAYSLAIKRSFFDAHAAILGFVLAISFTVMITDIVKNVVGRPRPDFIDRCQIAPGSADATPFGLSNSSICTQTDAAILKDGFRSFPSGHSSISFAGLGFLSFYLAGKLHIFDRQGHTWKSFICLVPLLAAALVALSRTMDFRHHWQDVFIGSILGWVIAWYSYRQYFPAVWQVHSDKAYSPRYDADGNYVGRGPARHEAEYGLMTTGDRSSGDQLIGQPKPTTAGNYDLERGDLPRIPPHNGGGYSAQAPYQQQYQTPAYPPAPVAHEPRV